MVEWSEVIVKEPFSDFISYASPTSAPASETNSIAAIPSDPLEFFKVNAPAAVPVVNRKSPSVAFEIVSPLPKVMSLPVTVRSVVISTCHVPLGVTVILPLAPSVMVIEPVVELPVLRTRS